MQVARVRWAGAEQFIALAPSGHAIPLDCDRDSNTAPGPMELLLVALGTCTAVDVVSILKKKRQKLEALEIDVCGDRAKEPPTVWTKIEVFYKLRGTLEEKAVRDAITLSQEKYCSVSAMLKKAAPITFRFEIEKPA